MKFEAGKFYVTSLGNQAKIYAVHTKEMHGVVYKEGAEDPVLTSWQMNGLTTIGGDHLMHVGECQKPPKLWLRGSVVEVSNNGEHWYLRRFYSFDPNYKAPFSTNSDGSNPRMALWQLGRIPTPIIAI